MKQVDDDSTSNNNVPERKDSKYKDMAHREIVKQFSRVSILDGSNSAIPADVTSGRLY